jgi:4-hydroxybutyrate CoA-transferase
MSAELMGSVALFEFVADNPLVVMEPFDFILDPARMADMGQMIAVNSAVQIDLSGQVNAESVNGRQISGVGGSFDFVRGALDSPGGRVVVALPSEAGRGRFSRIVAQLDPGAPVSIPRHHVQTVVTEHGIAHLEGLSLRGRAEALIAIASPDFREELAASLPYLEDKARVTSRAEACP